MLADPRLILRLGAARCLSDGVMPWRRVGGTTVVLAARIEGLDRRALERQLGPIAPIEVRRDRLARGLVAVASPALARDAETRLEGPDSCRTLPDAGLARWVLLGLLALACALLAAPGPTVGALFALALLALAAMTALRIVALTCHLRRPRPPSGAGPVHLDRTPRITMIVPLLGEGAVLSRLTQRLSRVDYPPDRLEILLAVEEDDIEMREALAHAPPAPSARVVVVPQGRLRTKPRALNHALAHAAGEIVGIWDAEDAPHPDQLRRVVRDFARAPSDVACLQGRLGFYNADRTWLTRCFALDYAMWWRLILPAVAHLGWAVPLGGTTLFLRRDALERVGAWDAHNVTEDADLGLRLARHGLRTQMLDCETAEEAVARPGPWIRQRSRWLKGYALTYAQHIRAELRGPMRLGRWRRLGVHVIFGGTLVQLMLAPLLMSLWLRMAGLPHPLDATMAGPLGPPIWALLIGAEATLIACAIVAARASGQARLVWWLPALWAYFPLAIVACWWAMAEALWRPFHWHKTGHGDYSGEVPPPRATAPCGISTPT
ncbi:MAG: glycosyltransferase [Paracoccaceae bacterium]